jgi:hypothetical protein
VSVVSPVHNAADYDASVLTVISAVGLGQGVFHAAPAVARLADVLRKG